MKRSNKLNKTVLNVLSRTSRTWKYWDEMDPEDESDEVALIPADNHIWPHVSETDWLDALRYTHGEEGVAHGLFIPFEFIKKEFFPYFGDISVHTLGKKAGTLIEVRSNRTLYQDE